MIQNCPLTPSEQATLSKLTTSDAVERWPQYTSQRLAAWQNQARKLLEPAAVFTALHELQAVRTAAINATQRLAFLEQIHGVSEALYETEPFVFTPRKSSGGHENIPLIVASDLRRARHYLTA